MNKSFALLMALIVAGPALGSDAIVRPSVVVGRHGESVLDRLVGVEEAAASLSPAPLARPDTTPLVNRYDGGVQIPLTSSTTAVLIPGAGALAAPYATAGCLSAFPTLGRIGCASGASPGITAGIVFNPGFGPVALSASAGQRPLIPLDRPQPTAEWTLPANGGNAPLAPVVQEYSVTASSVWSFERLGALSVSGGLGEALVQSPLLAGRQLERNQAMVSVALTRGAFSGGIVGHRISESVPGYPASGWGSLDLGVSWRTPWRGELSLGARNLVTAGDSRLLPDPAAVQRDDQRERTPYIEYRQDF